MGIGTVLTLLGQPEERRDPGLSEAAREAVLAAITGEAISPAAPGTGGAAATLRASLGRPLFSPAARCTCLRNCSTKSRMATSARSPPDRREGQTVALKDLWSRDGSFPFCGLRSATSVFATQAGTECASATRWKKRPLNGFNTSSVSACDRSLMSEANDRSRLA